MAIFDGLQVGEKSINFVLCLIFLPHLFLWLNLCFITIRIIKKFIFVTGGDDFLVLLNCCIFISFILLQIMINFLYFATVMVIINFIFIKSFNLRFLENLMIIKKYYILFFNLNYIEANYFKPITFSDTIIILYTREKEIFYIYIYINTYFV